MPSFLVQCRTPSSSTHASPHAPTATFQSERRGSISQCLPFAPRLRTRHFTCLARCTTHPAVKSRARGARLGRVALCAFIALSWTTHAQAFCRSMTCELGDKKTDSPPCPRDENQCVTQG